MKVILLAIWYLIFVPHHPVNHFGPTTLMMFTCTKCSGFCPYPPKKTIFLLSCLNVWWRLIFHKHSCLNAAVQTPTNVKRPHDVRPTATLSKPVDISLSKWVSNCGKITNWDAYSECTYTCPKNSPKNWIISAYPTCLHRKMPHSQ